MKFLSLPFTLKNGYLGTADLRESLLHSIGLIISCRAGTMPFDPEYGCSIWDKEFSDMLTANKSDIRSTLRNAIGQYEKRLFNVSVSFVNLEAGIRQNLGISVKVSGNYRDGDEEKMFEATYKLA